MDNLTEGFHKGSTRCSCVALPISKDCVHGGWLVYGQDKRDFLPVGPSTTTIKV